MFMEHGFLWLLFQMPGMFYLNLVSVQVRNQPRSAVWGKEPGSSRANFEGSYGYSRAVVAPAPLRTFSPRV